MKFLKIALFATALSVSPTAIAQDAATDAAPAAPQANDGAVAVGATINGNDGNPIGTVENISGDVVIVNTGKHMAPIPAAAIGTGENGLSVNISQAQLNEMMDAQVAEANTRRDAALVAGAEVLSANGNPVGTLAEVDLAADQIILESPAGKVALKKEHFAVDAEGRLLALFTREQITTAAAAGAAGGTGATN